MNFMPLSINGVRLIDGLPIEDERGHFVRLWCRQAFAAAGLNLSIEQTSASFNRRAGTVRGMHFAWPPTSETKLVRCARGRLHDVLLDLRPHSATFGHHLQFVLDADQRQTLVVPPGVAHGFQTLLDNTDVHYMMSESYRPHLADGVRFNDPQFGITWPLPVACISERDAAYPDFDAHEHRRRFDAASRGATDGA